MGPFAGLDLAVDELRADSSTSVPSRRRTGASQRRACRCRRSCRLGRRVARIRPRRPSAGSWPISRASGLPLAERIVTTSPDVTVSTNLGGWVSRRGVFNRRDHEDVFSAAAGGLAQRWRLSRSGQHHRARHRREQPVPPAGGARAVAVAVRRAPAAVGTLYDPFIVRGLDALNYACYQDARFLLVATPSGITLAPEGGAHQSIGTPLIGLGAARPRRLRARLRRRAGGDMRWSFDHLQAADEAARSICACRRARIAQPEREMTPGARRDHRRRLLAEAARRRRRLGHRLHRRHRARGDRGAQALLEEIPGAGLLAVTSADRLNAGWRRERARRRHAPPIGLLAPLAPDAALVTVIDGHPATPVLAGRACAASACGRWASSASASPATCRTSTATTVSTSTPSSTPARRRASGGEGQGRLRISTQLGLRPTARPPASVSAPLSRSMR